MSPSPYSIESSPPRTAFAVVGELDPLRCLIEQRYVGDVARAHPLADELDQRVEVELCGQGLPDAVHGRELGDALARLFDRTGAGEGGADMLADVGELLVLLGVGELLRVRLDDQGAHRPPFDVSGSEPVFAHLAPELELALRKRSSFLPPRKPLRFARSEDVGGGPTRRRLSKSTHALAAGQSTSSSSSQ